ncbi:hypothetical protein PHLGIDRAFT_123220 [Phlebiopsis gigantea 11061_1 CR5-6]|uniref:Uncharacterized protein n=1 Tax=Phlebiopsis gigantea (strain 11061_1 CR5-6) TaxID=745531 RepID=A0A0C3NAR8_PHLG1|nr:hypothetical protein PHLGIDRAFT_123220 [Phlebiopsis gigantea 11061_1 CR5-6]
MSVHEVQDPRPDGHNEKTDTGPQKECPFDGNVVPQDVDENPNSDDADEDHDGRALDTASSHDESEVAVDDIEDKSSGHERDGGDPASGRNGDSCDNGSHKEGIPIGEENGGDGEDGDAVGTHVHDGDAIANDNSATVSNGEKDIVDVPNDEEPNKDTQSTATRSNDEENSGENQDDDGLREHAHNSADDVANDTSAVVGDSKKDDKDVFDVGESNEGTNPPAAENNDEEPGNHPPNNPVISSKVMPLVPHLRHPSLVPVLVIRKLAQDESDFEDKKELGNHPPSNKPKNVMPLVPHLRHPSLVPGLVIPPVYNKSEAEEEEAEQKEAKKEEAEEEEEGIEDMYTEPEYPQSLAEETKLDSDIEGSVVTKGGGGTSGYTSDYEDEPTADEVAATGGAVARHHWVTEGEDSYNADDERPETENIEEDEEQQVESDGPENEDEKTSSSGETDSQLLMVAGSGFNTATINTREAIPPRIEASGHYYGIFRVRDRTSMVPQGPLFHSQEASAPAPSRFTPPSTMPGRHFPTIGQMSPQSPRPYPFTFAYPAPSMETSTQDFRPRRETTSAPAPPRFALPPANSVGRSPAYFTANQAAPLSPLPYPFTFVYRLPSVEERTREVGPRHRVADVPAPASVVGPSRPYSTSLPQSQAYPFEFRYPPPTGMYQTARRSAGSRD